MGPVGRVALSLALLWALAACSGPLGAAADLLTNDGPSVNTNAQVGRENRQAVVTNEATAGRDQVEIATKLETETIREVQIRNDAPWWIWAIAILGWLLPSPGEIGRWARGFFRQRERMS